MRLPPIRAAAAGLAAGALAAAAGDARAVDDTKPIPCSGTAFKDASGDQDHLQVPEAERTGSTEILSGFLKYDATKGPEATTYNLVVKELAPTIPAGWTSLSWNMYFQTPEETEGNFRFVRVILDFTGAIKYEHGRFLANPAVDVIPVTGANVYDGDTTGKFFEGKDGVIQVVVPADLVTPGMKLQGLYANSGQGRTLPSSAPPYSRGLSHVLDTAPDDAPGSGTGSYTVAPCPTAPPPSVPGPVDPGTNTPTTTGGPTSGNATLPVSLVRSKVRAPKRRTLAVKLRSTESVTDLGARLRKGRRVFGNGKLARLDGTGTMKLKLARKAKKGGYLLDLAGTASNGERRVATLKLRLR